MGRILFRYTVPLQLPTERMDETEDNQSIIRTLSTFHLATYFIVSIFESFHPRRDQDKEGLQKQKPNLTVVQHAQTPKFIDNSHASCPKPSIRKKAPAVPLSPGCHSGIVIPKMAKYVNCHPCEVKRECERGEKHPNLYTWGERRVMPEGIKSPQRSTYSTTTAVRHSRESIHKSQRVRAGFGTCQNVAEGLW